MRREDVQSLVKRIPPEDIAKVVLVMKVGTSINLDLVYKLEPEYMVVRGRESGTNDDGRGFFVPYDEIGYLKLEKFVKVNDLRAIYGETIVEGEEASLGEDGPRSATPAAGATTTPTVPLGTSQDPASIAKQNLLDRIRATRTSAGVPKPKQ